MTGSDPSRPGGPGTGRPGTGAPGTRAPGSGGPGTATPALGTGDPGTAAPAPGRRRDSARSRDRLLSAARELFAAHGFERTTVRELGERAGVDPALIARYFGSKTGLYVAALRAEVADEVPADLLEPARLAHLLERLEARGAGPVLQAAVHAHDDPDAFRAARGELHVRLVEPLRRRFEQEGLDRAGLRAELAVAAFAGIVLGRHAGALDELGRAAGDDLLDLTGQLLRGLLAPSPPAPGPPVS